MIVQFSRLWPRLEKVLVLSYDELLEIDRIAPSDAFPVVIVECQSDVLLRNLRVTYVTPFVRQKTFNASELRASIDSKITVTVLEKLVSFSHFSSFLIRLYLNIHQ